MTSLGRGNSTDFVDRLRVGRQGENGNRRDEVGADGGRENWERWLELGAGTYRGTMIMPWNLWVWPALAKAPSNRAQGTFTNSLFNQVRSQLGHQLSHKTVNPQVGAACRMCWDQSLAELSLERPVSLYPAHYGSRCRPPSQTLGGIGRVQPRKKRKNWRNQRDQEYQKNTAHGITWPGLMGASNDQGAYMGLI